MTSPLPLISVVIPAYNAARYLQQSIDSVLSQTYRNLEVIVVDDGSTDDTREVVRSYGDRVRYFRQENSGGVSRPRNRGLLMSRGDIIAFLDADDLMAPERLAEAARVLRAHHDVALVFTNFQHFDEHGIDPIDHFQTCSRLREQIAGGTEDQEASVLVPSVSTDVMLTENFGSSAPIVRAQALRAIGGYDEQLFSVEDFECHYRLAARHSIAVIPRVLLLKRRHGDNMSANVPKMLRANIRVRTKLLEWTTLARQRRGHRQMLGVYYLSLAYYYTGRDNLQATWCAIKAMRYTRRPSVRHLARVVADLTGRDTNGVRHGSQSPSRPSGVYGS